MSDEEGKFVIELQGIDKRHLAHVWQKMKAGDALEGQEVFIGRSMADHPQWYPFFTTIGLLGGDDEMPDGTNPFGHVSLHVLIGSQIFNQEIPEAETFYRMRLRKGDDSHSVIHMMIEVFQRHLMWAAQHATTPGEMDLDMAAYAATLRSLWRLKTRKLWQKLGHAHPPIPHQDDG
jgi:hypothetical protein